VTSKAVKVITLYVQEWEKGVERSRILDLVPAVVRILSDRTKVSQFTAKCITCIGSCLMKIMDFSVVPL
jgi:hypothetical protein